MNVKKLIFGFLILAVGTGVSALLVSNVGSSALTAAQINSANALADNSTSTIDQNAYTAQTTDTTDNSVLAAADQTDGTDTVDDPNNLTDAVADSFVDNLASTNASDLSALEGTSTLTSPDLNDIMSEVASSSALQNIQIPNWDAVANGTSFNIGTSSSEEAVENYATSLSGVFNQYFLASGLQDEIANSSADIDASDITNAIPQIQNALAAVASLSTPPALLPLQQSLVKVMVYDMDGANLVQEASTDPVQAALVLQAEASNESAAVGALENQIQVLSASAAFNNGSQNQSGQSNIVALLNSFLGIKTANAQLIVSDPPLTLLTYTNQQVNFSQQLWKALENVLLQIMKNTLIAFIQQRTLQWITGGHEPRFVQQFAVQLVNTGIAAANAAINSAMQCVYPSFQKPVYTTLQAFYKQPGPNSAAACPVPPLQTALGGHTLQQFYSSFSNGSWQTYAGTILPSGNYYGNLFYAAQTTGQAQQTQQKSTQAQSVATQGFNGDQVCDDKSDPLGDSYQCDPGDVLQAGNNCYDQDGTTYPATLDFNDGLCADGTTPKITTPGQTTNQGLSASLSSNVHLIVNANNITGILVAMVNSLFNSLMQAAITSATGAINAGLSAAVSNPGAAQQTTNLNSSSTAASPTPIAVACTPTEETLIVTIASSTQADAFFGATGGAADANGNEPTYSWTSAGGNPNPAAGAGAEFTPTYTVTAPGTYNYTVQLTASTGGTATCQVQVTAQ